MSKLIETPIMEWVNAQSGGAEHRQRNIMYSKILSMLQYSKSTEELAHNLTMAIAEYVIQGICGNGYRKETDNDA